MDADAGAAVGPQMLWLLMQERVGSTWFASTHLAQHPEIRMLKSGAGEACFGFSAWVSRLRRSGANRTAAGAIASRRCVRELDESRSACMSQGARLCGWKSQYSFCPTHLCRQHLWAAEGLRPIVVHLHRRDVLRQSISLALASHSNQWACKPGRGPCNAHAARPANMSSRVVSALDKLIRNHARRCAYLRAHVRRPWHQVAYEDLESAANVAAVYRTIGVNASWRASVDKRRRQSPRGAQIDELLGGRAVYDSLLRRLNRTARRRVVYTQLARGLPPNGTYSWCDPSSHASPTIRGGS